MNLRQMTGKNACPTNYFVDNLHISFITLSPLDGSFAKMRIAAYSHFSIDIPAY